MELPKNRKDAKNEGSLKYYTGKVCINNHLMVRNTRDGRCLGCANAQKRRSYSKNLEKQRRRSKIKYNKYKHLPERIEKTKEYQVKNWKKCKEASKRFYDKNKDTILSNSYVKKKEKI